MPKKFKCITEGCSWESDKLLDALRHSLKDGHFAYRNEEVPLSDSEAKFQKVMLEAQRKKKEQEQQKLEEHKNGM